MTSQIRPPDHPSPQSRALDRLLALQSGFARSTTPSAASFRERAIALWHLSQGQTAALQSAGFQAAWADAQHACTLDPAHPQGLAVLCQLAVAGGLPAADSHAAALELLGSPLATPRQRRHALEALDPAQLPRLLRLPLPTTERLTLLQSARAAITLEGKQPQDHLSTLGRSRKGDTLALDLVICRAANQPRSLVLSQGDAAQPLSVAALPAPAATLNPRAEAAPLWVIMPLRDGGAALDQALRSSLADLANLPGARLILVDDGSTEARTAEALAIAQRAPGVMVLRTSGGLGFTGAVNTGLRQVGRGPVLLLNSDIWLPAGSLSRMLAHLSDPEVGTVTPLSNNAGSFCLLGPGKPAAMPDPALCDRLAEVAARLNPGLAIETPSGNGFAMLISEPCLRAIGPLSNLYESGYYEEVDFCLRASARGWRHVAAMDCFVGHVGSVTYGAAKRRLVSANALRLDQRFPRYAASYAAFAALDPLAMARNRLLEALRPDWQPQPLPPSDPPHPGSATIRLPQPPSLPLVLPWQGDTLPTVLRPQAFSDLRLVVANALTAGGLRIDPGHDLCLRHAPEGHAVQLCHGQPAQVLASFPCDGADPATVEARILAVANPHAAPPAEDRPDALSL